MTHLRIELNTITENVTSNVIHKLYETAKAIIDAEEANDVQESLVSLKGNLLVSKAYGDEIDWLETKFSDLHITAGDRYIRFADDAIADRMIALYSGDSIGVTNADLSGVTTLNYLFVGNKKTQIQTFNELGSIHSITSLGTFCFNGCSNLRSIDLSNILYLGGEALLGCVSLSGIINLPNLILVGDSVRGSTFAGCTGITLINFGQSFSTMNEALTFTGCTGLTTITGFDNITTIPYNTFRNCSSLLTITSLSSTLTVGAMAFLGCTNLLFPEEITVNFDTAEPYACFRDCAGLTKVILGNNVTGLGSDCFNRCSNLTEIVGTDKITCLGSYALSTYKGTGTLDLSNWTSRYTRNRGEYTNSGSSYITDMPYITKVLIGDIDFEFNSSDWISFDTYRLVFVNMPLLTTVDFKSLFKFPNMNGSGRSALFSNCPNIRTIILRNVSVCPLAREDRVVESLDIGGSNSALYVPDNLVNDYKAATGWSNIASLIHGISELPST